MVLERTKWTMNGSICLGNNLAQLDGGALYVLNSSLSFTFNRLSGKSSTRVYFSFLKNVAINNGGAIHIVSSTLLMCGRVSFVNNTANGGGAVHTLNSSIYAGINCSTAHVRSTTIVFHQNIATYRGGSISILDSSLNFMGSVLFDGNTASYGGAIILDISSNLTLAPNLTTYFMNNRAKL